MEPTTQTEQPDPDAPPIDTGGVSPRVQEETQPARDHVAEGVAERQAERAEAIQYPEGDEHGADNIVWSEAEEAQLKARLDANAADLIAEAATLTDVDELKALRKAEKKGKARTTVIAAYDERIKALKE